MVYFSRIKLFVLLVAIITNTSIAEQSDSLTSYGVYGGVGVNFHHAEFKALPDCPNCSPGFQTGSGSGVNLGLVFDMPIFEQGFLSTKLLFKDISGNLTRNEAITIIQNGKKIDGEFEHQLDAKLNVISLEPTVKYNIYKDLYVNAGFFGSILIKKDYSQVENLTKPSDSGTFLDSLGNDSQSRERNKYSGTLKSTNSILFGGVLSVSYQLPINKNKEIIIEPEINYCYGFNDIVKDASVNKWTVNTLSFGLALKYSPKPKAIIQRIFKNIEKLDTINVQSEFITSKIFIPGERKIDTVIIHKNNIIETIVTLSGSDTVKTPKIFNLDAKIGACGVDREGREMPEPVFKVEEYTSNRMDPLLNFIFFEENSAKLPTKYKLLAPNQYEKFTITSLFRENKLDIYDHILNIVGRRLTDNPSAKIELIGCNSDYGLEQGNIELSKNRAEIIKKYLVDIWQIDAERVKIATRNLPQKPSTPKEEIMKREENQRVELSSDNYKILEPIYIEKIDRTANQPIIRFKPYVIAEAGVKKWNIVAYQKSDTVNKYIASGEGDIPAYIEWDMEKSQKLIPKAEESLLYILSVEDKKGNFKEVTNQTKPIKVVSLQNKRDNHQTDIEIQLFSLMLFDFDNAAVSGNNKKIIDFISGRIKPESEIEILGYSDVTGTAEYNAKLSKQRAQSVKAALKVKNATTDVGDKLLFDNNLPEGRFYSRTVEITVKTKIK